MNADTGATYGSLRDAVAAGERPEDLVEIQGSREQVARISSAVRDANRRRNRTARKSRRRNR